MCCECASDPNHPKRKTSICLKVLLVLAFLIGIAVIAVSIYLVVQLKTIGGFGIVVTVVGVAILAFSIVGFCGSGYNFQSSDNKVKLWCLRIFWINNLVIVVVLLLVGLVCVVSKSTIEYYVIINLNELEDIINDLPDSQEKTYVEKVDSLVGNVIGVGILSISTGAILIIPWLVSSCLLGERKFFSTVGIYGSLVISVLGVVVIAVDAYFYAYVEIAKNYSGLLIGILVLGAVLVVLGLFGALGYCLEERTKWPIRIFAVLLCLILLAFLVFAILAFAMSGTLKKTVDKGISAYCGLEGEDESNPDKAAIEGSECYPIVKNIVKYLCNENKQNDKGEMNPCPPKLKENNKCECSQTEEVVGNMTKSEFYDAASEYTMLLLKGNYIVVGVVGFVVVAYLIMMVVVVFIAGCRAPVDEGARGDQYRPEAQQGAQQQQQSNPGQVQY